MRRPFREVTETNRDLESFSDKKEEVSGYKEIKPETNITIDEALNYLNSLFESSEE